MILNLRRVTLSVVILPIFIHRSKKDYEYDFVLFCRIFYSSSLLSMLGTHSLYCTYSRPIHLIHLRFISFFFIIYSVYFFPSFSSLDFDVPLFPLYSLLRLVFISPFSQTFPIKKTHAAMKQGFAVFQNGEME